jgi:hypothetical protein
MKKNILISFFAIIGLLIFITSTHAIDIDGWWVVRTNLLQGDFQTGEWTLLLGYGKKISYMYILNAHESVYGGPAWLFLWDDKSGGYIKELYPIIYIKNSVIVLFGPTMGPDANGDYAGNTIVLRPYGSPNAPYLMSGHYALYDTENIVTPDQFVRMGTLNMSRIDAKYVPKDVKDLQIAP